MPGGALVRQLCPLGLLLPPVLGFLRVEGQRLGWYDTATGTGMLVLALVALAHLYVTLTKRDVKHDVPELTQDLALRVLRSAFARPTLSEDEGMDIIDYHIERNRVAHDSHRKSWLAKHKELAKKLLL